MVTGWPWVSILVLSPLPRRERMELSLKDLAECVETCGANLWMTACEVVLARDLVLQQAALETDEELKEELLRNAKLKDEFAESIIKKAAVFGDPGPMTAVYFDRELPN